MNLVTELMPVSAKMKNCFLSLERLRKTTQSVFRVINGFL